MIGVFFVLGSPTSAIHIRAAISHFLPLAWTCSLTLSGIATANAASDAPASPALSAPRAFALARTNFSTRAGNSPTGNSGVSSAFHKSTGGSSGGASSSSSSSGSSGGGSGKAALARSSWIVASAASAAGVFCFVRSCSR